MLSTAQVAVSPERIPVPRDHQPVVVEATRRASLPPLPVWANTAQGRAIIRKVMAEKPGVRNCDGTIGSYQQFTGRSAAQLRNLWAKTYASLIDWVGTAEHGSPLYEQRRSAVVAYAKDFNSDAVLSRCLGENLW